MPRLSNSDLKPSDKYMLKAFSEAEGISRVFNANLGALSGSAEQSLDGIPCTAAAAAAASSATDGDPAPQKRSPAATPRRDRVDVFRRWACETFGKQDGEGTVLDVAGGKGDLSWLLANADGMDAVVCDPRPVDHSKLERRASWLHARLVEGRETIESLTAQHGPQGALAKLQVSQLKPPFRQPGHLQVYFDHFLGEALERADKAEARTEEWSRFWELARKRADEAATPQHHQPAHLVERRREERGREKDKTQEKAKAGQEEAESDADAALRILLGARLLLAFHPDEAVRFFIS